MPHKTIVRIPPIEEQYQFADEWQSGKVIEFKCQSAEPIVGVFANGDGRLYLHLQWARLAPFNRAGVSQ